MNKKVLIQKILD